MPLTNFRYMPGPDFAEGKVSLKNSSKGAGGDVHSPVKLPHLTRSGKREMRTIRSPLGRDKKKRGGGKASVERRKVAQTTG